MTQIVKVQHSGPGDCLNVPGGKRFVDRQLFLERGDVARFFMRANQPVELHILDDVNFRNFLEGRPISSWGAPTQTGSYARAFKAPASGMWHFVLFNTSSVASQVSLTLYLRAKRSSD